MQLLIVSLTVPEAPLPGTHFASKLINKRLPGDRAELVFRRG
jgi:hypothetical protein